MTALFNERAARRTVGAALLNEKRPTKHGRAF